MSPHGQKQKRQEDKRSPEEIALESAKNSPYNMLTPMIKAEYIRFRNPITSLDKVYKVQDPEFYEIFYEFSQKGLEERLFSELNSFVQLDSSWKNVIDALTGYIKIKNSDSTNDEHQ